MTHNDFHRYMEYFLISQDLQRPVCFRVTDSTMQPLGDLLIRDDNLIQQPLFLRLGVNGNHRKMWCELIQYSHNRFDYDASSSNWPNPDRNTKHDSGNLQNIILVANQIGS